MERPKAYTKPRGCSSDFEILERIYDRYASSDPSLQAWDDYWQDCSPRTLCAIASCTCVVGIECGVCPEPRLPRPRKLDGESPFALMTLGADLSPIWVM